MRVHQKTKASLLFFSLFFTIAECLACSCVVSNPSDKEQVEQMLRDSQKIFVGKVQASIAPRGTDSHRSFRFEVYEVFKGQSRRIETVFTSISSAACGTTLATGKIYLVAARGEDKRLLINSCERPVEVEFVQEQLRMLRQTLKVRS
ncbi:hypothetical protein [Undibacterium fentianense]|uniref:Lipoprotein n=1 Tax=Undibacterium fentianense TaxID=2828728 RepID=A0A941E5Y3_9BURK|nr:hypothetical protein [Undibacterium fentianense]MBR7801757.1 hypothetical protein [Undibacterium fentianense]